MIHAGSAVDAMRLDALSANLRLAQEAIGGSDRELAIWRLKAAREQITQTIKRLEAQR